MKLAALHLTEQLGYEFGRADTDTAQTWNMKTLGVIPTMETPPTEISHPISAKPINGMIRIQEMSEAVPIHTKPFRASFGPHRRSLVIRVVHSSTTVTTSTDLAADAGKANHGCKKIRFCEQ